MNNNKFTLCYRDKRSKYKWNCEHDFKSIHDADSRAFELLHQNNKLETRLYPFNKNTPKFIQKSKITYDLSYVPEINIIDNKNTK